MSLASPGGMEPSPIRAMLERDFNLMREQPYERGMHHRAVSRWYAIFRQLTGVDAFDFNGSPSIMLPSGEALGCSGAAFCLLEAQRTAVFLRGIENAIRELQNRFPGERIRILYAGCGPYATLLLPLTSAFPPSEIGWHLLDINSASLKSAKLLHKALDVESYLLAAELADASTFVLPHDTRFHLVISETMQRALQNETQLSIMLHLIPQLDVQALFLPKRISVHAAAMRWATSSEGVPEPAFHQLGSIYEISREQIDPPGNVSLTVPALASPADLVLRTEVQVYKNEILRDNDTSITLPKNMRRRLHGGERLNFQYRWLQPRGFVCDCDTE